MLLFIAGASILAFPFLSDYFHAKAQTRVIEGHNEALASIDKPHLDRLIEAAREYNEELRANPNRFHKTDNELARYHDMLQIGESGSDIIGTLEIERLGISLPIYLGTDDDVLRIGLGHIEGTSLPVGGPGTHTAITGHRGLPTASLLTDIDRMEIGDIFTLNILNLQMHYMADQIEVVLPDDFSKLSIYPDKDYATLLTCTPIGVNTHRLLVRGIRLAGEAVPEIEAVATEIRTSVSPVLRTIALFLWLPLLILLLLLLAKNKTKASSRES
jgi:sortase A